MSNELIKRFLSSVFMLPIIAYVLIKGSVLFVIFSIFIAIISIYEWYNLTNKNKYYRYLGIIFLIISTVTFYLSRNFNNKNHDIEGLQFITFVIIICILTDIGGYLFGKTFKGIKLTIISPNKTYSGVIGSFLLPLIFLLISLSYNFEIIYFNNNLFYEYPVHMITGFVIFISLISQIGDLIISLFKRIAKVKDTSTLIPGHGGLLDRIDGMLFAIPFSYLLIQMLK